MRREALAAARAPAAAMAVVERLAAVALAPVRQALPFELGHDPLAALTRPEGDIDAALRAALDRPRIRDDSFPMRAPRAFFPAGAPAPGRASSFARGSSKRAVPAFAAPAGLAPAGAPGAALLERLLGGGAGGAPLPASRRDEPGGRTIRAPAAAAPTEPPVQAVGAASHPVPWPRHAPSVGLDPLRRAGHQPTVPAPDLGLSRFAERAGVEPQALDRPLALAAPAPPVGEPPPVSADGPSPVAGAWSHAPATAVVQGHPAGPARGSGLDRLVAMWSQAPSAAGAGPVGPMRPDDAAPPALPGDPPAAAPALDDETLAETLERLIAREARRHGLRTDEP